MKKLKIVLIKNVLFQFSAFCTKNSNPQLNEYMRHFAPTLGAAEMLID